MAKTARDILASITGGLAAASVVSLFFIFDLGQIEFMWAFALICAVPAVGVLAYQLVAGVCSQKIRFSARRFWSVVLGCLLLEPLGSLFNREGWPIFHTWGLGHGSFIIAIPILSAAWFYAIGLTFKVFFGDPLTTKNN